MQKADRSNLAQQAYDLRPLPGVSRAPERSTPRAGGDHVRSRLCRDLARWARCVIATEVLIHISFAASCAHADTPLDATRRGDMTALVRMLDGGAAADVPTDWIGRTPLMIALSHRNRAVAQLLVAHGADVCAADKAGRSAAFFAMRADIPAIAARCARAGALETVLGETLVHAAVASGDVEVARPLLTPKVLMRRTRDGRTLIHFARGQRMVLLLLDRGLDVNETDDAGRTALHRLAIEQAEAAGTQDSSDGMRAETARVLLVAGADATRRDEFGMTAADYWPKLPSQWRRKLP